MEYQDILIEKEESRRMDKRGRYETWIFEDLLFHQMLERKKSQEILFIKEREVWIRKYSQRSEFLV